MARGTATRVAGGGPLGRPFALLPSVPAAPGERYLIGSSTFVPVYSACIPLSFLSHMVAEEAAQQSHPGSPATEEQASFAWNRAYDPTGTVMYSPAFSKATESVL
jgi:hypothetical protein